MLFLQSSRAEQHIIIHSVRWKPVFTHETQIYEAIKCLLFLNATQSHWMYDKIRYFGGEKIHCLGTIYRYVQYRHIYKLSSSSCNYVPFKNTFLVAEV